MAAAGPRQPEIIDLSYSSDGDGPAPPAASSIPVSFPGAESGAHGVPHGDIQAEPFLDMLSSPAHLELVHAMRAPGEHFGGQIVNIDGEDIFIPDEEEDFTLAEPVPGPASPQQDQNQNQNQTTDRESAPVDREEVLTAHDCLRRVLEIFPDIDHAHVTQLYDSFDSTSEYETFAGTARLDSIIDELVLNSNYPKQERAKATQKKRKREDSVDENSAGNPWVRPDRPVAPSEVKGVMRAMLKAEFPDMTVTFCNETLAQQKHFFQAYVAIVEARDGDNTRRTGRPSKVQFANADTMAASCGWAPLFDELLAARKLVEALKAERANAEATKQAELDNLHSAMEAGETVECSACYDDLPMNRQVHCDGRVAHFTCFDCLHTYIKSEVGESRCRVLCPAGCTAPFAPSQLNLLADKDLLGRLAELEQEKAIRDAGLDDLEECPFCDYKAILPPVEEDFEFRCANPECEKISCRRCKSVSHIPSSCEQHAKDNRINNRHKIEEAMTAALIRTCNNCNKKYVKEYGCNKMTCPSCGTLQCYVCSKTVTSYDHFDQGQPGRTLAGGPPKKCPMSDNVEERHEREVREAGAAARAQVAAENPDMSTDDLEIKMSDAVKKVATDRMLYAHGVPGIPYGGVGGAAHLAGLQAAMRGEAAHRHLVEQHMHMLNRHGNLFRAAAHAQRAGQDAPFPAAVQVGVAQPARLPFGPYVPGIALMALPTLRGVPNFQRGPPANDPPAPNPHFPNPWLDGAADGVHGVGPYRHDLPAMPFQAPVVQRLPPRNPVPARPQQQHDPADAARRRIAIEQVLVRLTQEERHRRARYGH